MSSERPSLPRAFVNGFSFGITDFIDSVEGNKSIPTGVVAHPEIKNKIFLSELAGMVLMMALLAVPLGWFAAAGLPLWIVLKYAAIVIEANRVQQDTVG